MNNKTEEKNNEKERHFYAWECAIIDNRHRPNGRRQIEGCKKWQIKSSKWLAEEAPHGLMVSCKHGCLGNGGKGPRKARLSGSTRKFHHFTSKEMAEVYCKAKNEQGDQE